MDQLQQGLLLLIAGMGTVFVFLSLMVLIMQGVGLYFKRNESKYREDGINGKSPYPSTDEKVLIAAIVAAIKSKT